MNRKSEVVHESLHDMWACLCSLAGSQICLLNTAAFYGIFRTGLVKNKCKHSSPLQAANVTWIFFLLQGMVAQLEKEIVEFFTDCPGSVYLSHLASSFERLLLHAVCQYLGLHCRSMCIGGFFVCIY